VAGARVNDRRVHRTRHRLHQALGSLLHEKSYDAIAVKEITALADVGRSAFYTHFRDKDALLVSGIRQILADAPRRRLPPDAQRFEKLVSFSLPVLEHIDRLKQAAGGKMGRRSRALVHRHLGTVLLEEIGDDVRAAMGRNPRAELPPALLANFIVQSFMVVLEWWADSGSRLSARQADDLFLRLVLPVLAAAVHGS
jgi:AcrR family transcriptional regulator